MNLLPMKYYIVVADQKSITRAAEELHITQQTLSAHMAALEKELKCQLFQRRPKFELTYEGRVFYRYCQSYQRLSASMEDEFRDINSGQGGLLRLGIAYTRGRVLLPRIIPAFNKLYPKVQVRVKERSNEEMVNMLIEDELDVVIGRVMSDVPELSYKELYHAQMTLYLCEGLINPFKLDALFLLDIFYGFKKFCVHFYNPFYIVACSLTCATCDLSNSRVSLPDVIVTLPLS